MTIALILASSGALLFMLVFLAAVTREMHAEHVHRIAQKHEIPIVVARDEPGCCVDRAA
jgi:hypothetical protein